MNYVDHGDHIKADGLYIPKDPANSDFAAYLAWEEAGNVADQPVEDVALPPGSVTMRQARLALLEAGQLSAINAAITGMPSPQREAAQIEWEFAATVDRDSAFLQGLAQVLGLTEAQLDALFLLAASK